MNRSRFKTICTNCKILFFLCSAVAVAGAAARGAVGPDVSCVVSGVAPCAVANFLVHCFALHCLLALRCLLALFFCTWHMEIISPGVLQLLVVCVHNQIWGCDAFTPVLWWKINAYASLHHLSCVALQDCCLLFTGLNRPISLPNPSQVVELGNLRRRCFLRAQLISQCANWGDAPTLVFLSDTDPQGAGAKHNATPSIEKEKALDVHRMSASCSTACKQTTSVTRVVNRSMRRHVTHKVFENEESLKSFPLSNIVFQSNTHCTCICIYISIQHMNMYWANTLTIIRS